MAESNSLARPRFFSGKLLTAEDFEQEQQYVIEKQKRHNRSLHGFGIVSGLNVTTGSRKIAVEPGLALDCQGNEIVIGTVQLLSPTATGDACRAAYVNIRYAEEGLEPVTADGGANTSTIKESFQIAIEQENCNRGHRHVRARWLACGTLHALTIAKLKHSAQGWRVDRSYRPPGVK
jgi:hypothetical protein